MLAASGLSVTWLFHKARILAIFDDLDTVVLMIPLKMLMVGLAWQLGIIVVLMAVMLWLAWQYLHRCPLPVTWPWVLSYAFVITVMSELIYATSRLIDDTVPIHIEVLLPAFMVGCILARPAGSDPHRDDAREGHQEGPESAREQRVSMMISAVFMVLVGLNMPPLLTGMASAGTRAAVTVSTAQPMPSWETMAWHVLFITVLANLGKMFPPVCYRQEAHWKERLALAIGLWPRGEVGASVLMLSLAYGLGGPMITVAMLCLVLNLVLTGAFIVLVKKLAFGVPLPAASPQPKTT